MSSIQKILLGLFLVLVFIYSSYEVYNELKDWKSGEESATLVFAEIMVVVISFIGVNYFLYLILAQSKQKRNLELSLKQVKKDLESSNIRLRQGKQEFQKVIQWQFKEWQLSPSEREVALLMLKGLSIREIANARETQEKTVRKQASSIYGKSKLAGRHELSAWFFEDLL